MSRAERLLDLLQILRRYRTPVAGAQLAAELGVSLRTIYRDIQSLAAQGAQIDGEAGLGFVLRPGFLLPPLMFTEAELEALSLGAQWVKLHGDPPLARAATDALTRIGAILPHSQRDFFETSSLLAGPSQAPVDDVLDLVLVRRAIATRTKLKLDYADAAGAMTERLVWPIALAFFDSVRVLVAWCELRGDFRHFRADRVRAAVEADARYARPRRALLKEWRDRQAITGQAADRN